MCGTPIESLRHDTSTETIELRMGTLSRALRVRDDGIQVGCTFVTKAALEFIIEKWNDRVLYD
jgi:hypothetical protein